MIKITKSSFALIISMLFMIAVTSCEKEESAVGQDDLSGETEQDFSGSLIRVMGETSGGSTTKTTLEGLETWWRGTDEHGKNADNVGIYSPQARPTSGGEPGVVNAEFIAENTGKSSEFAGEMYWGENIPHNFYSYYSRKFGTHDFTVVPISLPDQQTQSESNNSGHIGLHDFMVATPLTGVSPGSEGEGTSGINFRYNHVFTLLEFQITGSGSLSKVKLSGPGTLAFSGGTIDITQGTPIAGVAYTIAGMTGETGEVTITLITPVELGVAPVSVYMMINPGDHSGNLAIGLEIDGDYTYMSKSPPEGGFERGKKYVVEQLDAGDFSDGIFDIDGNEYETVIIGDQEWMAENLRTSKYNDGSPIVEVSDGETWANLTTGAYCWYQNDSASYAAPYGALYNFYTVSTGKLCPTGWHVATQADWGVLTDYLGGTSVAGGKLKETGTLHWVSPNTDATNETNFSGVPGGQRIANAEFHSIGEYSYFWCGDGTLRWLYYEDGAVTTMTGNNKIGFSIRCIKD